MRICIIQTAFPGDVVLSLGIVETLAAAYPGVELHLVVRQGNESLVVDHPLLAKTWVWNKKSEKWGGLIRLAAQLRALKFDAVVNAQRFFSSGLLAYLIKAPLCVQFNKNPLSFLGSHRVKHEIGTLGQEQYQHELQRNHSLLMPLFEKYKPQNQTSAQLPKLYPTAADRAKVAPWQQKPYVCIAPASVWFTKQFPAQQWAVLAAELSHTYTVYLIGGPADSELANGILQMALAHHANPNEVQNLCGQLGFTASAALMAGAVMNYTCDSAPLHMAGAVSAPVTAVFCSTIPEFGFGPMGANGQVVETTEKLDCRPCGLHGHKACPQGHFKCATSITTHQLMAALPIKQST